MLLEYCHALLMLKKKGDRVNLKFNFNLSTRVRLSLARTLLGENFLINWKTLALSVLLNVQLLNNQILEKLFSDKHELF